MSERSLKDKIGSALKEVILIVIGILVALFINNWNTERVQKKEEIAILQGIKENILLDTIDINLNIRSYKHIIRNDSLLTRALIMQKPYSDTVMWGLASIYFTDLILVLHNEYYEKAKSTGLNIISNKDLRNRISRLYEFEYPYLLENEDDKGELLMEYFNSFLLNNSLIDYRISNEGDAMTPFLSKQSYQKLLKDKQFHLMVGIHRQGSRWKVDNAYLPTREKALTIVADIDEELQKRGIDD